MGDVVTVDMIAVNGVVGFVLSTFIIPIVQQPTWSQKTRSAVTFGCCLAGGIATSAWLTGFDKAAVGASVLLVFLSAITTYKGLDKTFGIAPAIEQATSPPPG